MATYRVKFFGAKQEKHEQVRQVKLVVEAKSASEIEEILRHQYGYKVINGLKIRQDEGGGS
jgi:hypothetical protein